MINILLFLALGLTAGTISGLIGIGGGVLVTLAMLVPPIGILGAWTYYQKGFVNVQAAGLICLGFVLGGLIGAKFAVIIPAILLKRVFGIAMLGIAVQMLLF